MQIGLLTQKKKDIFIKKKKNLNKKQNKQKLSATF